MASADQLLAALQDVDPSTFDENERARARDALFGALRKFQSPWDLGWDQVWVYPATNAAIKGLIDAGIFTEWVAHGSRPQTSDELAGFAETDAQLVRRLLRHIATQHLIIETAEETYAPTAWAIRLGTDPAFPSLYGTFYHEMNLPLFQSLPAFLEAMKFPNPTKSFFGNFQFWKGVGQPLPGYIASDPVRSSDLADAMECQSEANPTSWTEFYPTESIVEGAKWDRPLVVDIGGGKGRDLESFSQLHPDLPEGSLVLQELPDVVEDIKTISTIFVHSYDAFEPQPIKGARVYFMHNVLNERPNDTATKILKNVVDAMEKGYSRLLIHESILSKTKPLARVTTSDITKMAYFSSAERTESEWRQLIAANGLQIVKIWKEVQSAECVIEASLA